MKLKERSTKILTKLFDDQRKQEGGSFSVTRDLLIQEFKELPILEIDDYIHINLPASEHFSRENKTPSAYSKFMQTAEVIMRLDNLRSYVPK
jgi:hypothetical protein